MKFIFPENYNYKNRLFGMFDYSTAIVNILWGFIIYNISKNIPFSFNIKITFFITFYFPLFLFSLFGFNRENILYFSSYMFKFIKRRKVYFFSKD